MKKALSVVLSLLVILSAFGMFAAAEEEATTTAPEYKDGIATILFFLDEEDVKFDENDKVIQDNAIHKIMAMPGEPVVERLENGDEAITIPTKTDPEKKVNYIFECWKNYKTGERRDTSGIPAVPKAAAGEEQITEVIYVAVFAEEDIMETQTFWAFVQTIFARINMIFEYFAKVFEGLFD